MHLAFIPAIYFCGVVVIMVIGGVLARKDENDDALGVTIGIALAWPLAAAIALLALVANALFFVGQWMGRRL